MASSEMAKKISKDNKAAADKKRRDAFKKKIGTIYDKYSDTGTSGKVQMEKEIAAAKKAAMDMGGKAVEKHLSEALNIHKYGKDAMKSRAFGKYEGSGKSTNKGKSKGSNTKKTGYSKGGMVSCGASNPPGQKRRK